MHDKGGSTDTNLLVVGNSAIDAGDAIHAPPRDQRGVTRPPGPASDIGPAEVEDS